MMQNTSRFHRALALFIALLLVLYVSLSLSIFNRPVAAQNAVRIMPLGDSITAGVGSSTGGGYRVQLWQNCAIVDWHITFVGSMQSGPKSLPARNHEGHPGWRIADLSRHIAGWLKTYQPQIILLQIGTNDILRNDHVEEAPARLNALVRQISTILPKTIMLVAQITPLGDPKLNAQVNAYNKTIPAMVENLATRGVSIKYVDMYHAVSLHDLPDGIHPNDKGYESMSYEWFKALYPIMER